MTDTRVTYPELAGHAAVVTGAAQGMGQAHAAALLRNHVNVVAGDVDADAMTATADRLNAQYGTQARVVPASADVTRREDHAALAALTLSSFGRLDHWVNNAGVYPRADVLSIDAEHLELTSGVLFNSVIYGTQAAAAAMHPHGGSVVNITSTASLLVRPGYAAYGSMKAASDHLTHFLAVELGPSGIRVNAVAPGIIRTGMNRSLTDDAAALETATKAVPLRRLGDPHDVADAMLFLISDGSSFITGHTVVVDGGGRHR